MFGIGAGWGAMSERRATRCVPRAPIGVRLFVDGYLVGHGDLADLSLGGAGFVASEGFRSGDNLEFHLFTDETLEFTFRTAARVVWSEPGERTDGRSRCGVRWVHLPNEDLRRLAEFIGETCSGSGVGH
jgi:hypothetical protein